MILQIYLYSHDSADIVDQISYCAIVFAYSDHRAMPAVLSTLRKQDATVGFTSIGPHIVDFGPTVGKGMCESDPQTSVGEFLSFTIFEGPLTGTLVACKPSQIQWRHQRVPLRDCGIRVCEGCQATQHTTETRGVMRQRRSPVLQKFQKCSGCMQVYYCSRNCARLDWPAHQRTCYRSD